MSPEKEPTNSQNNYFDDNQNEEKEQDELPEPDSDNITVFTNSLPNEPILPWHHFDSPWQESEANSEEEESEKSHKESEEEQ
ncbi:MAG: hypothetical protein BRC40_14200 [Cyanobacteria bacterium QH_8_48_120]|jgi:hypothetical protein|nr:MAG: hypothetical protein BRC34_03840 [Cyanobacteria bacterium QH_1_48_107]PSO59984.1 MAG: hypothetical protein BRC39_10495 [Cyanobacteria bacterium QH_7_48_89]PSO60626.1 MAG: hypothetical protein BRC35_01430 [Cyanobacteria bacterium QH_10_48_56]PSO68292.1 MAG: hypothetical protein BRC38_01570 [Cyanobacteria bacterium QH_6_48_35]PSO69893.1 MAG: hypothetical protein BRC40_14200 [Cyanobacteria bacterium QH_8_48_120]PSO71279.1 MAG: hypothetical protein BRC37_13910 [Cyanobacteria bacterium QH_3